MPTVPEYNLKPFVCTSSRRIAKPVPAGPSDIELQLEARRTVLLRQRETIMRELADIKRQIAAARRQRLTGSMMPQVYLYALKLDAGRYYIGLTYNVERRFKTHCKGKGAAWTKRYRPVEIIEARATGVYSQNEAAKLEDDMTIEYALKFGSDVVRGGGYCQMTQVHWPAVVLENEQQAAY